MTCIVNHAHITFRGHYALSRVSSHRTSFRTAVAVMAALAVAKLGDELLRLVWRSGPTAAIDLKSRHAEVHAWFAGVPVYETMPLAAYPPATYALLWPMLGWLPLEPARWLWAGAATLAIVATVWIVVRASGASDGWGRAFAALIVLAPNQTGVAVGNGQLITLALPAVLAGILLIHRGQESWLYDTGAAAGVLVGLVKITLVVPFLWLVLFTPSRHESTGAIPFRLRPAALVAAGYAGLTWFAMTFQPATWREQLRGWLARAEEAAVGGGNYADVHAWLTAAGLESYIMGASAALFLALGAWLARHRHADLWILLGVTALVARFWTYHRLYDDVLVVIAMVALLRIARQSAGTTWGRWAGVLLGVTLFTMLLPARLGTAPFPWRLAFTASHTLAWLAMLAYLIAAARRPATDR